MKIKQILIVVLLGFGLIQSVQAQTFEKLWKQVEQAEDKSLPQTVIQLTSAIYQKAEKEKNTPQMLKAYTWRMKYRDMLTPDSFFVSLQGLERWMERTDKSVDRAILNSLIAGIYSDYASMNRWKLRRQRDIVDEMPSDDIREWTGNMFVQKIVEHTKSALKDSGALIETSARNYTPFVKLGNASDYYRHDMYHLLGSRSIEALEQIVGIEPDVPINEYIGTIYANMLSTYEKRNYKDAYVLVMLDCLRWKNASSLNFSPYQAPKGLLGLTQDPYLAGLNKLLTEYGHLDICAEVYLAKAMYALNKAQEVEALKLCEEAIRKYPKYNRINALKNLKTDILAPYLSVNSPQVAYPGEEVKMQISHNNLDGVTLKLYKTGKLISEQHYTFKRSETYKMQDTAFVFKAPENGKYTVHIIPDVEVKEDNKNELYVTRFKALTLRLPNDQCEIFTLDSKTGHPIPNARVVLYGNQENPLLDLTTDVDGKVVFKWEKDYQMLSVSKGEDSSAPKQRIYFGGYSYNQSDKSFDDMLLLTDRSLYRPGQTIYIKGIAYKQNSDTAHVIPNKDYELTLSDVNNQEVSKKTVRTNDFGSFTAEFILPSACLNGSFQLKAGNKNKSIQVEDYKRPTFDITFEKQTDSYKVGDKINIKGKVQTYSGVPLQNTPLKYVVKRSVYSLWRMMQSIQIASGELDSNNEGVFSIPVLLEPNADFRKENNIYYRYTIEVAATNAAGETQLSTETISAGERSLLLNMNDLGPVVCKDSPVKTVFTVQNLSWQPVKIEGTYHLYHVSSVDENKTEGEPVLSGTFSSNKEMLLDWKKITSGSYWVVAITKDTDGNEIKCQTRITLFSTEDTRPPVMSKDWYYAINEEFSATHPAIFYYGTSLKDVYVIMKVFSANELLESKIIPNVSDTIMRFEFPYKESYAEGVTIAFCYVKDEDVYQRIVQLKKSIPSKKLSMKWNVFRDKLSPGEKEEWKLTIQTPHHKPANAEMLATMYDASLDKIWKENTQFGIFYNRSLPYVHWNSASYNYNVFSYSWNNKYLKVPEWTYDRFLLPLFGGIIDRMEVKTRNSSEIIKTGLVSSKKATVVGAVSSLSAQKMASVKPDEMFEEAEATDYSDESLAEAPIDLRTNFSETAFFYPQLRTNEQGEVSFSFTMPESLTRWNFHGYSHTQGMLLGTLDCEATTSKEFMLTPNLPRFVRVGDKTSVAASIINITGKVQKGVVSFILFDPVTDKVVSTTKQNFTVDSGQTIGVNFMFTATDKYEILGCRMIADSETFSDGEQQLLPVLSNKEYLVETVPMPIRGEQKRVFSLDKLFNHQSKTATDRRLTVEFTTNPTWYAIQALPSLSQPTNNDAISWASAYYANSLASFIMNSQPRIKAVFDSWKLQGGTKETFMSNLQKNQEVKNILLSESPWVTEAQTEEEQKERISMLFDLNNIRNNNITILAKLKELQDTEGAWSWYKGMNGSSFVTTYIAELNARLAMLTNERINGMALQMQQSALAYLHKQAFEEYQNIRKSEAKGNKIKGLSGQALRYLYVIAISGEKVPAAYQQSHRYFLSKVNEMLTDHSMDVKALSAIILEKAGYKKEAQEFTASLKQYLTQTDEQGMFFAFNENPYSLNDLQIPVHVAVMEALGSEPNNASTIEEMKLWLLKQKQTIQWNSPIATVNAVFALLMQNTNLLDNQGNVRITIANKEMNTASSSDTTPAGLGYLKCTFTQKDIVNAHKITVEKQNQGIAWGAVYGQYQSPLSDIEQQGGELNIKKQLYVERTLNTGVQLQPITDKTVLNIGDKVVSRLTIRLDRPMDFIQLKDQRGACFEPVQQLSGYRWNNGFGYYVDVKDASTNFFFDSLGKGVHILEYSYRINRSGTYEAGTATLQSAYAPEFVSHSSSMRVNVK